VHFKAKENYLKHHFDSKTDTPEDNGWRTIFKTATPVASWRIGSAAYDI